VEESCQGWGSVAGMKAECTEVEALPRDRTKGEDPRCACCCTGAPPNSCMAWIGSKVCAQVLVDFTLLQAQYALA
jgi:hypothetical protein